MNRSLVSVFVCVGFLAICGPAVAAPPSMEPNGSDRDPSLALARQGLKEFKDGHFENAKQLFERAYHLSPSAKILVNLAVAELNAGDPLHAAEHFRSYLKATDATPERIQAVRSELLPGAYAKVVRVIAEVQDGTPVELDGQGVVNHSTESEALLVLPGEHVLRLADGREIKFTGKAGNIVRLSIPEKDDGRETLARTTSKPSGSERTGLDASRSPSGFSARTWTLLTGTALTAIAGGTGAVFGFRARADDNEASRLRDAHQIGTSGCNQPLAANVTACANLQTVTDNRVRDANISLGAVVAAGVVAAATVTTFFLWKPARSISVTPSFGAGTVQFHAGAAF